MLFCECFEIFFDLSAHFLPMNDIFALAEGMELLNGKYTIIRMLSHGGFGVTYLAHHNPLDIDVCIKEFFPKDYCNRDAFSYEVSVSTSHNVETVEHFMRKFIKEAKSIARQHHESIIKILDIFEENGTAYYVMDYIEGQSLKQLVETRGPLPLGEALGYIRQTAGALGYLHGRNMNHLDVKPSNMMVDHSGKLTLIDFGLSKHYGDDGRETTMTPMCISRGYSPKEQYLTGGVSYFSPAADIYALGATLYYLLTGQNPPEAVDSPLKKLVFPASVPENVKAAIRHAMQYEPEDRTPSAAAFLDEIAETPAKVKRSVVPPKKEAVKVINEEKSKSGRKVLIASGIVLLVMALIFAGYYTFRDSHGDDKKETADTAQKATYGDIAVDTTSLETPNIANENNLSVDSAKTPNIANENNVSVESTKNTLVQEVTYGHKKGHTGDLITKKGGEYVCFTPGEWQKVPDKSAYTKLGVVVNDGTCPAFYVTLHDKAGGEEMTWYDAVNRYGEGVLPSKEQCEAIGNNKDKINNAMRAFGGTVMDQWYWGKEDDSSSAWNVGMNYGNVPCNYKTHPNRLRPVARVAESAK